MSVPVRRFPDLPSTRPERARPEPQTKQTPAARQKPEAQARSRSRGFVVLASVLVGGVVFGIVILNVLLAQASFRTTEAEHRLEALSQEHRALVREQATLSAPGRIAAWAARHNMRLPDDIQILHVTGGVAVDPAGADPAGASPGTEGEAKEGGT
ncbi:MAG: hypothetical protein WD670_08285 [Actinomycetota bacterium]